MPQGALIQKPRKARPDAGNARLPAKEGGSWLQTTRHIMNLKNAVLALTVLAFVGFVSVTSADDTRVAGRKSLESRIAELEAKLQDAGVGGGVKGSGIKISGYVDTSYTLNLADRTEGGPFAGSSSQNTGRVFDNQYDAFNLNAVKLTIQKDKDSSKFPAGFRTDVILGEDANILNTASGVAPANAGDAALNLEQAYVNLGVPIGNGIDVKVGKMVSLIGYEAIESPANWQFSRSDGFRLAPNEQTGVTFGYKWNDIVTSTVGVINGWQGQFVGGSGGNGNTDLSFVGRLDFTGPKTEVGDFTAFAAAMYGNDNTPYIGAVGLANTMNSLTTYIWELGGTWAKPFGAKDLTLGVDYLWRHTEAQASAAAVGGAGSAYQAVPLWAGALSVYGKYDWSGLGAKWTSTSARFSWSQYDNNGVQTPPATVGQTLTLSPLVLYSGPAGANYERQTDLYSFTLTQAFNVWKDTLVRLEWRHDWTTANRAGFGGVGATAAPGGRDDIRQDQDTIAVNVVYSF